MIFLYILGGLVALVLFILFLPVHFTASYDGKLQMYVRILFVRIDLTKVLLNRKNSTPSEEKKESVPQTEEKQSFGEKVDDVLAFISTVKKVITETLAACAKYVRIKVKRFYLRVSFPDAAKTALAWGVLKPATDAMFDMLHHNMHFTAENVAVCASFADEGFAFSAKIAVKVRVIRIVQIALNAITIFTQQEEV